MAGRPKADTLYERVQISVRPEDLETIDANAKACGLSRSEYLVSTGIAPDAPKALKLYTALKAANRGALDLAQTIDDALVEVEAD